jgi:SAM-dependent methyltransferase
MPKYEPQVPGAKGVEVTRDGEKVRVYRLNPGCGAKRFLDCANLDRDEAWEPDFVGNLELPGMHPSVPVFPDDTFDSVYCSHTLEHIWNPLVFLQELHRICVSNAIAIFRVPYGSSDNAWEDPTHVRPYFLDSFGYFSQAAYGGADYGYRGDWAVVKRELLIRPGLGMERYLDDLETLLGFVMSHRNIVEELKVTIRCVKPIRTPGTFREGAPIEFVFQAPTPANDPGSRTPS